MREFSWWRLRAKVLRRGSSSNSVISASSSTSTSTSNVSAKSTRSGPPHNSNSNNTTSTFNKHNHRRRRPPLPTTQSNASVAKLPNDQTQADRPTTSPNPETKRLEPEFRSSSLARQSPTRPTFPSPAVSSQATTEFDQVSAPPELSPSVSEVPAPSPGSEKEGEVNVTPEIALTEPTPAERTSQELSLALLPSPVVEPNADSASSLDLHLVSSDAAAPVTSTEAPETTTTSTLPPALEAPSIEEIPAQPSESTHISETSTSEPPPDPATTTTTAISNSTKESPEVSSPPTRILHPKQEFSASDSQLNRKRSGSTLETVHELPKCEAAPLLPNKMGQRKVWVKRPGASPTMVTVNEDDLVDDVRDMILRKYGNSLGRSFDSPDLVLRIVTRPSQSRPGRRDSRGERMLGPEEAIGRTLDVYYPGGQTVEEALLIEIPPRRTPRPSPGRPVVHTYHHSEDLRPGESGTEYFPPMPAVVQTPSSAPPGTHLVAIPNAGGVTTIHQQPHAMSVLTGGQLPPLPSPGAVSRLAGRPKLPRQHTAQAALSLPPQKFQGGKSI